MTAEVSDPVIVQEVVATTDITEEIVAVTEDKDPPALHQAPMLVATVTSPLPKPSVHPEIHTVKAKMRHLLFLVIKEANSVICETLLTATKSRVTGTTEVTVTG